MIQKIIKDIIDNMLSVKQESFDQLVKDFTPSELYILGRIMRRTNQENRDYQTKVIKLMFDNKSFRDLFTTGLYSKLPKRQIEKLLESDNTQIFELNWDNELKELR